MPNYKNGKIYSIRSYQTDDIYIGSTTRPLSERMADHRKKYKQFLQGKNGYLTSFDIIKRGDAYIELIQAIPCNNVNELTKFEGNYIRHMNCVNKCIPHRTQHQYYIDNKNKKLKQFKQYYEKNKNFIDDWRNEKINCICGAITTNRNKARHNKTLRHKKKVFILHNELNHL